MRRNPRPRPGTAAKTSAERRSRRDSARDGVRATWLLLRTRFPTAGSWTGAGALGRVRLNKWIKFGTQMFVVFGLAALAAHLEGSTAMIASSAVNLAVAIGVAVGGRVGSSSEGGGPSGSSAFGVLALTGARRP